jgi:hypothetical protein
MNIEAGKYYRTRDGQKVGPMCHPEPDSQFCWNVLGARRGRWSDTGVDGEAAGHVKKATGDLIAEWTDAPDLTAITTPKALPWARVSVEGFDADGSDRLFDIGGTDGLVVVWDSNGAALLSVDPANARALASALTAYADQMEVVK